MPLALTLSDGEAGSVRADVLALLTLGLVLVGPRAIFHVWGAAAFGFGVDVAVDTVVAWLLGAILTGVLAYQVVLVLWTRARPSKSRSAFIRTCAWVAGGVGVFQMITEVPW